MRDKFGTKYPNFPIRFFLFGDGGMCVMRILISWELERMSDAMKVMSYELSLGYDHKKLRGGSQKTWVLL